MKFISTSIGFFTLGLLLTGCVSVNVPDYSSLNQTKKLIDLKKGYVGEGKYTFVNSTNTNLTLDLAGYNKNFSNVVEGDLTIQKNANEITYIQNIKFPFWSSDIIKLDYYSDQCGVSKTMPFLTILNQDGSVDSSSYKVRNNKKIREILANLSDRKNIFACSDWHVNQIKDAVDYLDTLMAFTVLGDKLTFVPLSLPVKYNGVVTYNNKEYYYFTIDNGKVQIDSQNFNDDIAKFNVTAKILVNMNNYITEYINLHLNGNMWLEGYNFNVDIKSNEELIPKINN